ncbi:MAG: hypothetical protein R3F05_15745 [Planctomycetota bacterium]
MAHVVPLLVTDAFDDAAPGACDLRASCLSPVPPVRQSIGTRSARYLAELAWNPLALPQRSGAAPWGGEDGSLRVG